MPGLPDTPLPYKAFGFNFLAGAAGGNFFKFFKFTENED